MKIVLRKIFVTKDKSVMLKRLYEDEESKDVTFELDSGRTFSAHRCVLRVSSVEWFRTLFNSNFKDSREKLIDIHDCSDTVFELILRWAYELGTANVLVRDYFEAADRFVAPSLIEHYVDNNLNDNNHENYVAFLAEALKYPTIFKDVLATVKIRGLLEIKEVLREPLYKDRAQEIIFFMLKNCQKPIKTLELFLSRWISIDDIELGKPLLDMRNITELLLAEANFIQPDCFRSVSFKQKCQKLVTKGYYTHAEIDKLNIDNAPFLIFKSYPLKIAKLMPIDRVLPPNTIVSFIYHKRTGRVSQDYDKTMGTDGYYYAIEF